MNNPFTPGDFIFWKQQGFPSEFYMILEDDKVMDLTVRAGSMPLDLIMSIKKHKDGPYRVLNTENWALYDFKVED